MSLLPAIAAIVIGFALLVWSADKFVLGASNTARIFGLPPLIVGVVIVGIGTSAPEMLVSAIAAMDGKTGLSIGNAIGSNITNIGLILGFTALFYPLIVNSRLIKREIPVLLIIMALSWWFLSDGHLAFFEGAFLLSGMVLMIAYATWEATSNKDDAYSQELLDEIPEEISKNAALMWLLVGIVILIASSKVLVWGAVEVAVHFGLSELIIGLTIIAIGTSLPELAATFAAARKQEFDLAVGNVIGSNTFNLLGVMALPGLIHPSSFDTLALTRDYPVMIVLTVALLVFAIGFKRGKPGGINRFEGFLLLAAYTAYMVYLGISS
ncbi:Inner membrane protein YrbG [Sinobacterium norvegicum]|uniref:Inner membrane protein YrbG n=1 Tax=Sinobacterium norvegicum TaxID=1641715 RepID=A0ABN8ELZ9_9GAMM|nr:calcium/sodium antiporter [Sinobacterium norvegicum]CAH0992427.1 Inner membrane protein YrbG [Sinobacterium norvegicum]